MVKTIFITGASRGLGFETGRLFASNEWNVAGTSTSQEGCDKIASYGAEGYVCDVKDERQIQSALDSAVQKFSTLDVLVNNAAITGKGEINSFSPEKLKEIMEVDLIGQMLASQKAVEIMKKQGYGHLINICSTFGIETPGKFSLYCAAKHGLRAFSRSLMKELVQYNINVSIICPGGMQTDFHKGERPAFLKPAEVAKAVYFVATRPHETLISELVITPRTERKYMID